MSNRNIWFKKSKLHTALFTVAVAVGAAYFGPANAGDLTGYLDNYDSTINIGQGGDEEGLAMHGGYIDGGLIQSDAQSANLFTQDYSTGTLESVTINGSLDITGNYAVATIRRGLTVNDVDGNANGAINITGNASALKFNTDLSLDNVEIAIGSDDTSSIRGKDFSHLSLGENAWLIANNQVEIDADRIVNQGYLEVGSGDTSIYGEFINEGVVVADTDSTLRIDDSFSANYGDIIGDGANITFNGSNYGSISTSGGNLNLNGFWNEKGSQIITQDTNLGLGGWFMASDVNLIDKTGGRVTLIGHLDNSDNTLDIGDASFFAGLKVAGGTIVGGVVKADRQPVNLFSGAGNNGILDGVTIDGTLNIKGANAKVTVLKGITITQSETATPNSIRVSGANAELSFEGDQVLDNTLVKVGSSTYEPGILSQHDGELALGQNLVIETNANAIINAETIRNEGSISVITDSLQINGGDFSNVGTIKLDENTNLFLDNDSLANYGLISLSDGSYFQGITTDFYNAGSIELNGGFMSLITDFQQSGAGLLSINLNSDYASTEGALSVVGDVNFGGSLDVGNLDILGLGDMVTLISFTGNYLGGVFSLTHKSINDLSYSLIYGTNSVKLLVSAAPVPLPAAVWLFGFALFGFLAVNRRQTAV